MRNLAGYTKPPYLTDRDFHTLTLFLDRFKTEYYIDYTLVFAAILLTMLPMLLLYIFLNMLIKNQMPI